VTHDATDEQETQGHPCPCHRSTIPVFSAVVLRLPELFKRLCPRHLGLGLLAHVLLITGTEEMVCPIALHTTRSPTDGFSSTCHLPQLGHTEHRHGVCSDSAPNGASPCDPGSGSSRSRRSACTACACRRPTCSGSPAG